MNQYRHWKQHPSSEYTAAGRQGAAESAGQEPEERSESEQPPEFAAQDVWGQGPEQEFGQPVPDYPPG